MAAQAVRMDRRELYAPALIRLSLRGSGGIRFNPHRHSKDTLQEYLARRRYDQTFFVGGEDTRQRCFEIDELIEAWWFTSEVSIIVALHWDLGVICETILL